MVDLEPRTVTDVVAKLGSDASIFIALSSLPHHLYWGALATLDPNSSPFFGFGVSDIKDRKHDLYICGVSILGFDRYFQIEGSFEAPTNDNSAYGALCDRLKEAGFRITVEPRGQYLLGTYQGPKGGRAHLLSRDLAPGKPIKGHGIVLRVERSAVSAKGKKHGATPRTRTPKVKHKR